MKKVIHFWGDWGITFLVIVATIANASSQIGNQRMYFGSVHRITGTTVLCTVFVDTDGYEWDFNNEADALLFYDIRDKMGIAAEYVEANVHRYNKDCTIIYDMEIEPIWYHVSLQKHLSEEEARNVSYVHSHCQEEFAALFDKKESYRIMDYYRADNVFCFFILKQEGRSYCISCHDPSDESPEYSVMFSCNNNYYASDFAHEFLHSCGAIDLYREEECDYGISADFDSYLNETDSHDVMRWSDGEECVINGTFSELDAYYCGLTDEPEDIAKYHLEKSIYAKSY